MRQRKLNLYDVSRDNPRLHRRKSDSTGETILVEGGEERRVHMNSGESDFGEQIVGIESNNGNDMEVFPQYTLCDDGSKEEKYRDVEKKGGSLDSWDEASDIGILEYEIHMDDEDGWNMGLRSLQSLGSRAEEVISTKFGGIVSDLEKEEPDLGMKREMTWEKTISTVQRTDDDEEQLSIEIRKMKKKSWWENINNWYVTKFNSIQGQRNDEIDSSKEEEIIFLEDSELPFHTRNCEQIDLQGNDEWKNEIRMGSFALSTHKTQESLIFESFGNTSESESEITIGLQDNHVDIDAYMKLQQNQKPTRRQKMLRKLINSQSHQSLSTKCEEETALSSFKTNPLMMNRREYDDESNKSWTCEKMGRRTAIRSEKVKAILHEIESCGTSDVSSEETYRLCVLEEISLAEPCNAKLSLHVASGCSTTQTKKIDENKMCEERQATRTQICISREEWTKYNVGDTKIISARGKSNEINEVLSTSFLTKIEKCRQTIPTAIYIVDEQKLHTRSEPKNPLLWNDEVKHKNRERANTVRGGSGGKVTKNIQEFLSQLKEINEACPRQRTHELVAKTRDRDLFHWLKQQKKSLGVLPQVHLKQCGQAKRATTNDTNLSCKMNNGKEKCKTLTDCNIELSLSKISKRACANSKISGHLIGKPKISKVRDSMESSTIGGAMTSENIHHDETGQKNKNVCHQFYSIFRKINNIES